MFHEIAFLLRESQLARTAAKKTVKLLAAVAIVAAIPQLVDASGNGIIITCQGNVGPLGEPHARNAFIFGNYKDAMSDLPIDIQQQFGAGRKRMERSQLGPLSLRIQSIPGVDPSPVARGFFVTGLPRGEGGNTPTK
jgi:hypothetical protein